VVETKYVLKRNGPLGSTSQTNAAATFFAKSVPHNKSEELHNTSQHRNSLNNIPRHRGNEENSSEEREKFPTNFRALVHRTPPPIPSLLLKKLEDVSPSGGKVKVFLRVTRPSTFDLEDESNRYFYLDRKRRQVTLFDPSKGLSNEVTTEERCVGVAAPKMYAFDGVFTSDDSQVKLIKN